MNATWTYGSLKVEIKAGLVTHSDFAHCVVGQKPNLDALRMCGWKKVKPVVHHDAWGRKITR
jgi:hypothetical protein